MGKPAGKRRRTVRARLKERQVEASKAGGEVCSRCGQAVPFESATFYLSGGQEAVYCLDCAFATDGKGYVAMLWEASAEKAPERGREGESAPPAA